MGLEVMSLPPLEGAPNLAGDNTTTHLLVVKVDVSDSADRIPEGPGIYQKQGVAVISSTRVDP